MNLSLEGKTALVCGSSQGIGFSIAEELAIMGANCILLARNKESLQTAVQLLDTSIRQIHSIEVADFKKPDELKKVIENVIARTTIHILINNTGGPPAGPIIDASEDEFMSAFNQHLICNHL